MRNFHLWEAARRRKDATGQRTFWDKPMQQPGSDYALSNAELAKPVQHRHDNLAARIQQAYDEIEEIEPGQKADVMAYQVFRTKGHDLYVNGRGPYSTQQAANIVCGQRPGPDALVRPS